MTLTPKAFDLLRVLVEAGDRVAEKNELMKLGWPDSFVSKTAPPAPIAMVINWMATLAR